MRNVQKSHGKYAFHAYEVIERSYYSQEAQYAEFVHLSITPKLPVHPVSHTPPILLQRPNQLYPTTVSFNHPKSFPTSLSLSPSLENRLLPRRYKLVRRVRAVGRWLFVYLYKGISLIDLPISLLFQGKI